MAEVASNENPDEAQSGAAEKIPTGLGRVRDLIIAKPELIRNDEGLMRAIGVRPIAANVVDFGPAALARLVEARDRETSARQEIEQIAQANFDAQTQTHAVTIDLLQARNNADLALRVEQAAVDRFGLAAGVVVVEGPGATPTGWRPATEGFVDEILGPQGRQRIGSLAQAEAIFGEAARSVRSMALVRLTLWSPQRCGLLAFGSPEDEGFRRDMGVELIAFLAQVVERTAERWPPIL